MYAASSRAKRRRRAVDALVHAHIPLAEGWAKRLTRQTSATSLVTYDEYRAEALYALHVAARKWPERGPFGVYAGVVIMRHLVTLADANRLRMEREAHLSLPAFMTRRKPRAAGRREVPADLRDKEESDAGACWVTRRAAEDRGLQLPGLSPEIRGALATLTRDEWVVVKALSGVAVGNSKRPPDWERRAVRRLAQRLGIRQIDVRRMYDAAREKLRGRLGGVSA